jgi:dipeptidyl aminopeptidase/acylaminoacyl peptidase
MIRENPDKVDRANPINYIKDSDVPPFLIIHGNTDKSVEMRQSELLYEALKKAEADVTFIPVKNAGHSFKGDHVIPGREEINRLIMEFFNRHLKR